MFAQRENTKWDSDFERDWKMNFKVPAFVGPIDPPRKLPAVQSFKVKVVRDWRPELDDWFILDDVVCLGNTTFRRAEVDNQGGTIITWRKANAP